MPSFFKLFRRVSSKDIKCPACNVRLPNGRDIEVSNTNPERDFNGQNLFDLLSHNLQMRKDQRYFGLVNKIISSSGETNAIEWVDSSVAIGQLLRNHRQILLHLAVLPKQAEDVHSSFVLELLIFHFASLHEPVYHNAVGESEETIQRLAIVRKYLLEASNGIPMETKRVTDAVLKTAETKRKFINDILKCQDYSYCWYEVQDLSNRRLRLGINQDEMVIADDNKQQRLQSLSWVDIVDVTCKKCKLKFTLRDKIPLSCIDGNTLLSSSPDSAAFLCHHLQLHIKFLRDPQTDSITVPDNNVIEDIKPEKSKATTLGRMRNSLNRSFRKSRQSKTKTIVSGSADDLVIEEDSELALEGREYISRRLPSICHIDPRIIVNHLNGTSNALAEELARSNQVHASDGDANSEKHSEHGVSNEAICVSSLAKMTLSEHRPEGNAGLIETSGATTESRHSLHLSCKPSSNYDPVVTDLNFPDKSSSRPPSTAVQDAEHIDKSLLAESNDQHDESKGQSLTNLSNTPKSLDLALSASNRCAHNTVNENMKLPLENGTSKSKENASGSLIPSKIPALTYSSSITTPSHSSSHTISTIEQCESVSSSIAQPKSGLPQPRKDSITKSPSLNKSTVSPVNESLASTGIPTPKIASSSSRDTLGERRSSLPMNQDGKPSGIPSPLRSTPDKSSKVATPSDSPSKLPTLTKAATLSSHSSPAKASPNLVQKMDKSNIPKPPNVPASKDVNASPARGTKLPQLTGIPRRQVAS